MDSIGLYVHIPFCISKCPYCDFYSLAAPTEELLERYTDAVISAMDRWSQRLPLQADTLYFGGGTPSLLGGERLARIIRHAARRFSLFDGRAPEITMEANPADDLRDTLAAFADAGGNRLSLGMQSAILDELQALGRRHSLTQLERAVADARAVGLDNLSLDLMLGVPGQTVATATASATRMAQLGARHVSAYMLKLEPDTPYGKCPPSLPDEDTVADIYLSVMEGLEADGYRQYEISNLAQPGFESRHNLKYWDSRPYLGLGPAASSCLAGSRFSYPRDIRRFMDGGEPMVETDDVIPTGSREEYAMLRLRLTDGLQNAAFESRFGEPMPAEWGRRAACLPSSLVIVNADGIHLTRQGFLVSNSLIRHILGE